MFKQYHLCNVFNTTYQIWLTSPKYMYQHQNILCYHWSAKINIYMIYEQRLFANLIRYLLCILYLIYRNWNYKFLFLPSVSLSSRNSSSPSTSTTTVDKTTAGAGIRKEKLLSSAPVISFGLDLEHWENPNKIEAPQIVK